MGCSASKKQLQFEAKHEIPDGTTVQKTQPAVEPQEKVSIADSEFTASPPGTDQLSSSTAASQFDDLHEKEMQLLHESGQPESDEGRIFLLSRDAKGISAPVAVEAMESIEVERRQPSAPQAETGATAPFKSGFGDFLDDSDGDDGDGIFVLKNAASGRGDGGQQKSSAKAPSKPTTSPKQPEGEPSPASASAAAKNQEGFFSDDDGTDHEALEGAWDFRRNAGSILSDSSVMNIPASPFGDHAGKSHSRDSDDSVVNIPISPVGTDANATLHRTNASKQTLAAMDTYPISHVLSKVAPKGEQFFSDDENETSLRQPGGATNKSSMQFFSDSESDAGERTSFSGVPALVHKSILKSYTPPDRNGKGEVPHKQQQEAHSKEHNKSSAADADPKTRRKSVFDRLATTQTKAFETKIAVPTPEPEEPPPTHRKVTAHEAEAFEVRRKSIFDRLAHTKTVAEAAKEHEKVAHVPVVLTPKSPVPLSTSRKSVAADSAISLTPRKSIFDRLAETQTVAAKQK